MTRNSSLMNCVRAYLTAHGQRERERDLYSTTRRAHVGSYLDALERTMSGVEAHAETLRQMRDLATQALVDLQARAEDVYDFKTQRYVAVAYEYMKALELSLAGEGAGSEQLEQLRLDYEEIKEFAK